MVVSEVDIPASNSTVSVSIIDTSWAYKIPCGDLFRPHFEGLDTFDICSYAFLVTRRDENETHLLFDLGIRKDWQNLVPEMVQALKDWGTTVTVEKELVDILQGGGTDLKKIESVIWRHARSHGSLTKRLR